MADDDRPHVVPCCFVLEAASVYSAVDHKPKSTTALKRISNIRARPVASLVVDHYAEEWSELWWVRVDGAARVVTSDSERAHAITSLRRKYPQYRDMVLDGPVIAIDVSTWRAWP